MTATCAWAWIRARSLHWIVPAAALVAMLSAFWGAQLVTVPLIGSLVQVALILVAAPALLVTVPLQEPFGTLSRTLPRGPLDRAMAVSITLTISVAALAPLATSGDTRESWPLIVLLISAGIGSVLALAELAWLSTIGLSIAAFLADRTFVGAPVTRFADTLGLPAAVALCTGLAVAYARKGPRTRLADQ